MELAHLKSASTMQNWGYSYSEIIDGVLSKIGLGGNILHFAKMAIITISLVLICLIADVIARKLILVLIERIIKKTKIYFLQNKNLII